jgi:hypothetical protein
VTVWRWFWHMKAAIFLQSWWHQFGHICAKILPVRDMRKSTCFGDSQHHGHDRTYVHMA